MLDIIQTGVIALFCVAINAVTHAFLDMNTRELYNLHNWKDFCSMEVIPGHGKGSSVEGTRALDQFCSNAFLGWQNLGEAALAERCPKARDPKCRPWKGHNKCTVRIQASNKTDSEKMVELAYCAQGVDWDNVMIQGGHPHPNGHGTGSEIE